MAPPTERQLRVEISVLSRGSVTMWVGGHIQITEPHDRGASIVAVISYETAQLLCCLFETMAIVT